jgi:hypothetical protein
MQIEKMKKEIKRGEGAHPLPRPSSLDFAIGYDLFAPTFDGGPSPLSLVLWPWERFCKQKLSPFLLFFFCFFLL